MGRNKIEIKPIEDESKRQVAFSKRHTGLFKKTAQLCSLYDAEAAVITFSPVKQRPHVFGHPNPDSVIDRFLNENNNNNNHDSHFEVKEKTEGKHEEEERERFWWEQSIDDLDLEGLLKFKDALTKMKRKVDRLADESWATGMVHDSVHVGDQRECQGDDGGFHDFMARVSK